MKDMNKAAFQRARGPIRLHYTSARGNSYDFSFVIQGDGSIRAYILNQPSYAEVETSLHATHRMLDNRGYYVDFMRPMWTLPEAIVGAVLWVRMTDVYIFGKDTGGEAARF